MKRIASVVAVVVFACAAISPVSAQSVGGGISVFVPLTMFQEQEGSVGFETSMETSLGLGPLLSLPLGVSYNQIWGLRPTGTLPGGEDFEASGPWFYSDSFLTYLMAKAHLPLGVLYFDFFGGGALNWNIALRPLNDRIARDLNDAGVLPGASGDVAVTNLNVTDGAVGWGWVAGAGIGVQVGAIGVDVNATYRHVIHNLRVEGEWFDSDSGSGTETFDTGAAATFTDFSVLLQGFAIGISGSFAM